MKYTYVLLSFFITVNITAQSGDETIPASTVGLSKTESKSAVELYLEMTNSDAYIESEENIEILFKNVGGLRLPQYEPNWDLKKFYTENLKKTKFSSVQDAMEITDRGMKLSLQMRLENVVLYALMKRATREQLGEIMQPERRHL